MSITVTPSPGAQALKYRLVATGPVPGPGSTVPDPAAAMAALERYGSSIFFPVPGPPRMCSDVYSGPQVAAVSGVFQGRPVAATFKRTDSCETARWQALAPLFGAVAGGTGAT
ncbi:serine protease inhibitor [Arthrobacter sp. AETb3-4]|uniref:Serine protease inhibitor n=1 Tax=Arthrobacter wenxiniae TaxID=2713570 RepID=A0A7Y7M0X0_9MICC|nr:serine protease inhibitor [Arthrobacter wenxiniae]